MKFSIIIPVYNGGKHIANCLNSLLCQSYLNWEAICIDDGSSDNSYELLNHFSCKDERIRVFAQENEGVLKARNLGIHHTVGDYLLFLDVDDTLNAEALQIVYNRIISFSDPDIVIGGVNIVKGNGKCKYRGPKFLLLDNISYLKWVLSGKIGWELWAKAYKKELFASGLETPQGIRIGEDAAIFIQLVCKAKTIVGCDIPIYNYVQYVNSVSHLKSQKLAEETLCAAFFIIDFMRKKGYYTGLETYLDAMCLLFYSNSTRRNILSKNSSLMRRLKSEHFSFTAFRIIPFYKAVYILIIYYFISNFFMPNKV